MKHVKIILTILFSFYFLSCNNDDENDILNPSSSLIEMEGEGGQAEISFVGEDWRIAKVINQNGSVNISGNRYAIDGTLIQENYTLKLDELGRIDAFWTDKGFSIIRKTLTSLDIIVKENSTGEDFNFVIVIESGNEFKEIIVKQKKSQGYKLKDIEYMLTEKDGDSIYVRQGTTYSFNIPSSQEISVSPINGINNSSHFESMEKDAFIWTEADSIMVKTPSEIENSKLYFNGERSRYTNSSTTKESKFNIQEETVTVPSGKSEFSIEIQYRRRKVSYTLYLENNRTGQEKAIKGKWLEFAPTGDYSINWKD